MLEFYNYNFHKIPSPQSNLATLVSFSAICYKKVLQHGHKYPKNSFLISLDLISVSNIVNFNFVSNSIQHLRNGLTNLRRNFELIISSQRC